MRMEMHSGRPSIVVIGAGVAGLATAAALAPRAGSVTVLDRDLLAAGDDPRKGVPQGRHAHGLLAGGAQALESLLPSVMADLFNGEGVLPVDPFGDGRWWQLDGYRARWASL